MFAPLQWNASRSDLLTTSMTAVGCKARIFTVVEPLINGQWNWTAWSNILDGDVLYSTAITQLDAMKAAECAALKICMRLDAQGVTDEMRAA